MPKCKLYLYFVRKTVVCIFRIRAHTYLFLKTLSSLRVAQTRKEFLIPYACNA